MTQYFTAREVSSELQKRINELVPNWTMQVPNLELRLAEAIADEPNQILAKMSYEDFLREFDGQFAEWEDGKVILMSPVSRRHQQILGFLIHLLSSFVEVEQSGEILFAPFQMRLAKIQRGREPDLIFIKSANRSQLKPNFLDGPADIAVEIISPESMDRDRNVKFREYEQAGVPEYWLIDPENELAEFFQLDAAGVYQVAVFDADGCYHSLALPGLIMNPTWFWQLPLPSVRPILRNLGIE